MQSSAGRITNVNSPSMFGSCQQQGNFSAVPNHMSPQAVNGDSRIKGTELVMLYDYKVSKMILTKVFKSF